MTDVMRFSGPPMKNPVHNMSNTLAMYVSPNVLYRYTDSPDNNSIADTTGDRAPIRSDTMPPMMLPRTSPTSKQFEILLLVVSFQFKP